MAALAVIVFWGGLLIAARLYPSEYDWRYITVSILLSPDRDPTGRSWASGGIALGALCGMGWAAGLARLWRREHVGRRPAGLTALQVGCFFMAWSAAPSALLPRVPKGHEVLAALAFTGLCLGMIQFGFRTIERTLARRMGDSAHRPRLYAIVSAGVAMLPILLAGITQAYVFSERPDLSWVGLSWRDHGIPPYLSVAFWEWITCVVISTYVLIIALAAHDLLNDDHPTPEWNAGPGWRQRVDPSRYGSASIEPTRHSCTNGP